MYINTHDIYMLDERLSLSSLMYPLQTIATFRDYFDHLPSVLLSIIVSVGDIIRNPVITGQGRPGHVLSVQKGVNATITEMRLLRKRSFPLYYPIAVV